MVAILGAEIPGEKIVNHLKNKKIDAIVITPSLHDINFKKKIEKHDIIHFIGSPTVTFHGLLTLFRFKLWKKKIVVTWRGSDILIAKTNNFYRFSSKFFQSLIDVNNALAPHMIEELEKIGVKTKLQPNPTFKLFKIRGLPNEKRFAVYLPDKMGYQWEFFQGNIIKKIVKDFPNIEFIITANSGKNFSEKNVKCFNWVKDMEEVYSNVLGVIRLPKHDGLSNTILEATSMGRTVIASSVNFSFCKIATNYEEVKNHIKEIIKNPVLNVDGSKYVHKNYDIEKITSELIAIYDEQGKK